MSGDNEQPVEWFLVFAEAIAKVDAGIYQNPLVSRDRLVALACAEAMENRLPMLGRLTAQDDLDIARGISRPPTPSDPQEVSDE